MLFPQIIGQVRGSIFHFTSNLSFAVHLRPI